MPSRGHQDRVGTKVTEQELLDFIANNFRSAWSLELLLMIRQKPQQAWRMDDLVRELRAGRSAVTEGLAELRRIGVVASDSQGAYRFAANSTAAEQLAAELAELYSRKPRAIMQAILSAPNARIRTFANAFRLRKDPT